MLCLKIFFLELFANFGKLDSTKNFSLCIILSVVFYFGGSYRMKFKESYVALKCLVFKLNNNFDTLLFDMLLRILMSFSILNRIKTIMLYSK